MQRFSGTFAAGPARRALALAAFLALAGPGHASAETLAAERASQREAAAQPGAFCTPARCRPASGSLWSIAAFGLAVLVIHRSARREPR
jgi:hypothetical protein